MSKQEIPKAEKISAAEEVERKSRKMAREIFRLLEDGAGFIKNEKADRGDVYAKIKNDIQLLERKESLMITDETFKKVREEASRILSHPGGKDQVVPEIFDLLSKLEKEFN